MTFHVLVYKFYFNNIHLAVELHPNKTRSNSTGDAREHEMIFSAKKGQSNLLYFMPIVLSISQSSKNDSSRETTIWLT